MSHITEVKTQIKDLACLKKTLSELGYRWEEAQAGQTARIKAWDRGETSVDLLIRTNSSYDIGVRLQAGGSYELVADWWGVETHAGFTREDFTRELLPRYSYNKVVEAVQARGYEVVGGETTADQTVKVVARKWA